MLLTFEAFQFEQVKQMGVRITSSQLIYILQVALICLIYLGVMDEMLRSLRERLLDMKLFTQIMSDIIAMMFRFLVVITFGIE